MPAMNNDIAAARLAIAELGPSKHLRRYPTELRRQLAQLVRAHPERSVSSIAAEVGVAWKTLDSFVRTARVRGAMVPVQVVAERTPGEQLLRVRGPHGIVAEGLDVEGLATLIRALS
jgi:transposase-like protein